MDDQRRIGPSFRDAAGLDEEMERFRQIARLSPAKKAQLYEMRLAAEREKAAIHSDYAQNWKSYVAEEERELRRDKPVQKFVPRWLQSGERMSRERLQSLAVSKAREKYAGKIAAVNGQVRMSEDALLNRRDGVRAAFAHRAARGIVIEFKQAVAKRNDRGRTR